jgi:hypothetical protein
MRSGTSGNARRCCCRRRPAIAAARARWTVCVWVGWCDWWAGLGLVWWCEGGRVRVAFIRPGVRTAGSSVSASPI